MLNKKYCEVNKESNIHVTKGTYNPNQEER
jgi:hypothetical protein